MGKAFEKHTKRTEDQGQKQIKAISDNKKQLTNTNADSYENKLLNSKQRELFVNAYNKDHDKLQELNKKINYDGLNYIVISTGEKN